MTKTIAAVIIAKNEERRIVPCLESVRWCDEIVVVDDIKNILKNNTDISAYSVGRRNYFLGRFMRHGGWYENHIRLYRRNKARYIGHSVHETLKVDGRVGQLDSYLDHYAFSSISQYINRQLYYATVESRVMYEDSGGNIDLKEIRYHLMVRPLRLFFKIFIKRQGFRDGMHGFIFSILNAWRHFAIWAIYYYRYYRKTQY